MNKLQQLKELMGLLEDDNSIERQENIDLSFYEVGKSYAIRCVTMIYTGKVKRILKDGLVLENAAWIADTGRFNEFVSGADPSEREPYKNPVIVYHQVISDSTEIDNINQNQSVI